jgi:hypothetical protein
MTDRLLLEDLIAKLREMSDQLSMAELEAASQSLLKSRIRHLSILAHYVRSRLVAMAESADLPPKPGESGDDSQARR